MATNNRVRIKEVLQSTANENKRLRTASAKKTTSDKKQETENEINGTTDDSTSSSGIDYDSIITTAKEYENGFKASEYSYSTANYAHNLKKQAESSLDFDIQNTNILGIPHQFIPTADSRIDKENNFGYCFAKNIFMERPIVTLVPGTTNFLPDMSKADKKSFQSLMTEYKSDKDATSVLENVMASFDDGKNVRYYDFKSDYPSYIRYVNLMCRVAAVYLGIGDEEGPDGTKYKYYDWATYQHYNSYPEKLRKDDKAKSLIQGTNVFDLTANLSWLTEQVNQLTTDMFLGYKQYVHFYVDTSTSVSESITNTTQKSQLEGMFDTAESVVKEATMILNSVSDATDFVTGFLDKATQALGTVANTVTFGHFNNMLQLSGREVLHGANLIYPEIWMDSEYSKDYSITVDLVSPYGSDEAIYLNIIVPMIHLLAFALPRQSTANSYISPFLVRGYSKGWFSCDMGIVTSISFDKGSEQSWTVNGLPSRVKVTMNIKDLYAKLMMTPAHIPDLFFTNQGMIDYLGSMCGLDLTVPNIITKMETMKALLGDYTPHNQMGKIYRRAWSEINNKIRSITSP